MTIDVETAKSTISTIVGSEATILSLVFTLSLVFMQQATSSYPPSLGKLFRDFKTNPSFKFTALIYVILIIFGVCMLIPIPKDPNNWGNFQTYLILSIFAFLSTLIFISDLLKFLVPKHLIKILKESENSSTSSIEEKNCISVLGILLNSFKKYDYSTMNEGLYYLENCKTELLEPYKNTVVPREYERYSKLEKSLLLLASYFSEVGKLSLRVKYKYCTITVIKNLYDIRKVADTHNMENIVFITTKSIKELAKEVIYPLISELNCENAEYQECAVFALGVVGEVGEVIDRSVLSSIINVFKNGDYNNV